MRRAATVGGLLAVLVVSVAGCSRSDPVDEQRAALEALAWPAAGEFDLSGSDAGRFGRLSRSDSSRVQGTPAGSVAAEVDEARAAGWRTVFAQCGGTWDQVDVHLVREVDGVGASAVVRARVDELPSDPAAWPDADEGAAVDVGTTVVMMAPQDVRDPALVPPAVLGAADTLEVDVSRCLDAPDRAGALGPVSVGTPAALAEQGGPLPDGD